MSDATIDRVSLTLVTLAERAEHRRAFAAALGGVDALLTPTAQTPAIPLGQADQSGTAAHFTRAGNYLGLCGVALPNGFTADGIGWAYEQATSWHERRPPEPAVP